MDDQIKQLKEFQRDLAEEAARLQAKLDAHGSNLPLPIQRKTRNAIATLLDTSQKIDAQIKSSIAAADAMVSAVRALKVLTSVPGPATVREEVTASHKKSISIARGGSDEFTRAFHKAGFASLRDLAAALNVHPSFLSKVRKGERKMPPDKAEKIEKLTGYSASRWPK